MIADAPQQHAVVVSRVHPEPLLDPGAGASARRVVMLGAAVGHQRRPVVAHPQEVVRGERQVLRIGPAEEIAGVAGLLQDLHQAPAVAEGVDVEGHPRPDVELLAEVPQARGDLAHERFARRKVAVGLQVPASDDVPAAGADQRADAVEEPGLVLLHPLVEQGLVVAEREGVELLTEARRRAKRRERGRQPFLPWPQPHGIDVRIADEHEPPAGAHASVLTRATSDMSPA